MLEKLKKPEAVIPSKPKFMISGESGVGKTTFALEFKKAILVDCENGGNRPQYQNKLKENGGMYFGQSDGANDFNEVIKLTKELATTKHHYSTLIIDSFSWLYLSEAAKAEEKVGNEFGRDKKFANMPTRQFMRWLEVLDMTVILTAHSKDKWERTGNNIVNVGTTFDGFDKMEFLLDLWVEIMKGGKTFMVRKSRIDSLPQNNSYPLSYDRFSELYGKDIIEKESIPLELASTEQVARLMTLIEGLKVDQEQQEKWLKKLGVDEYSEGSAEQIQSLIGYCEKKVLELSMKK